MWCTKKERKMKEKKARKKQDSGARFGGGRYSLK